MILGITGSIGSGKTTAAKLFSRHGYKRIDADETGHEILKNDKPIYKKLTKTFGKGILDKNGNIDRKKLGAIVFNDGKKLKRLNSITHPAIIKNMRNQIAEIRKKYRDAKIVIDAPLLVEAKAKGLVDKIIIVRTTREKIIGRSRKFTKNRIENILKLQAPIDEKLEYADFVIDNSRDLKHLEKQVKRIIERLENR